MPKRSKSQIEEDERLILKYLQEDSRQSIDNIAKSCKFSRQKVWRIIKRLEKTHAIWGYPAVIDDEMHDHRRFQLLIKRKSTQVTSDLLNTVFKRDLEKVTKEHDIVLMDSLLTHGQYDWVFVITAPNIQQVKKFIEAFQTMFSTFVETITILEVLFPVKKCGINNPDMQSLKDYFNVK